MRCRTCTKYKKYHKDSSGNAPTSFSRRRRRRRSLTRIIPRNRSCPKRRIELSSFAGGIVLLENTCHSLKYINLSKKRENAAKK